MYSFLIHAVTAIGLLGCITFVPVYWTRSKGSWRKTDAGRFLIAIFSTIGLLLSYVMFGLIYFDITEHPWTGGKWITLVVYAAFAAEMWWPLRLLAKADELQEGGEEG